MYSFFFDAEVARSHIDDSDPIWPYVHGMAGPSGGLVKLVGRSAVSGVAAWAFYAVPAWDRLDVQRLDTRLA